MPIKGEKVEKARRGGNQGIKESVLFHSASIGFPMDMYICVSYSWCRGGCAGVDGIGCWF